MRRPGLLKIAGLLVICQVAAAAVDVRLRNVETSAGPAYSWRVTSSIGSNNQNLTLYGNDTAKTTFKTDVMRVPSGNGYTIAGRVVITNTPDASETVYVESVRLLLGPGLPWFGPTPRVLDCRSREIVPGDSVSCAFRLHLTNTLTSTIKPAVEIRGQRVSVQGETQSITFPAVSASSDGSGCAVITQRIVAEGAERGIIMSAAGKAAELVGQGVRVCDESESFTYTATVGPFGGLEGLCGAYQYKDAPFVDIEGFGTATVTPATGNLFIGGCQQKDMLGMLKPLIVISKLSTAMQADASWTLTTSSSAADGSAPVVHHNGTVVVQSTIQVNKTVSAPVKALVGEVMLTNNQLMPYFVAGVRLVVTRDRSSTTISSSSSNSSQADATVPAALIPKQMFVDASCPTSNQGTIVVPPQLVASLPGVVRCTFDIPIDAAFASGTIQAQYKTVILNSYQDGVDSGPPTPYSFAGNATQVESGSCVDIWLNRIVNMTEVAAAELQSNPELSTALSTTQYNAAPLIRSAKFVSGRMPPAKTVFLPMPYTVCSNNSISWSEMYGPFTPDDCGTSMSILAITAKDSKVRDKDLAQGVLATPLTINGCGQVPQVSIADIQVTAKKVFNWSVEKVTTPTELALNYNQQGLVKYDIVYKRDFQITGHKLQALVGLTNPTAAPMTIDSVQYAVSRPPGQQPLTGIAVCNETFVGASHAAVDYATAIAVQGAVANTLRAPAEVLGLKNAVTTFTLPAAPGAGQTTASSSVSSSNSAGASSSLTKLKMFSTEARMDGSSNKNAAQQQQQQRVPVQAATPFYCSFVVPTPDDYPSTVSVRVMTHQGEEVESQALAPVDWTRATLYESGRCAQVSSAFQQTQTQAGASLLQPASISGSMPPTREKAVRICNPVTYSFTALLGPFKDTQCGVQQAIIGAAVAVPGTQPERTDNTATIIKVSGCPAALPILTLTPATATQITAGYEWTIERSMKPLAPATAAPVATAAGPSAGLNTPPVAGLTVTASSGSVALFNQTLTIRRSAPLAFEGANKRFQVKGTLNIVNPGDTPMLLANIDVKLVQPGVSKPVTTRVYCPMSYYKPHPTGKGTALEVPPATALEGKPLTCTYGAMLSSQAPAEGTASAVTVPDGRWVKSSNHIIVALEDVQPLTVGGCVKVSEQQTVRNIITNVTLNEPGFVGNRVPKTPEQICFTKTYQTIGQIGPLKPLPPGTKPQASQLPPGVTNCGAVKYSSVVAAEPTTGYQGKLISAGELQVNIMGCHLTS